MSRAWKKFDENQNQAEPDTCEALEVQGIEGEKIESSGDKLYLIYIILS